MGNINASMNSLGGYSSFNSVFGSGDANTPSLLDLSEFPSLTNRNSGDVPQPSPMPGAKPYVGMVKQVCLYHFRLICKTNGFHCYSKRTLSFA